MFLLFVFVVFFFSTYGVTNDLFSFNSKKIKTNRGNNATYRGGAIYGDYGSIYYISNTQFVSNIVPFGHGGAIFIEDRNSQTDGTFLTMTNCQFTSNSALKYGGACCWFNGPFITLSNTIFESNSAGLGGAITNYDDITYSGYSDNTFLNNIATEDSTYNDIYNDSLPTRSELASDSDVIDVISSIDITYYLSQLYDNKDVTGNILHFIFCFVLT